jgi:hypothetical protein
MTVNISRLSPHAKAARIQFMLAGQELLSTIDEKAPEALALAIMVLTDAAQFSQIELMEICEVGIQTLHRWKIGEYSANARPVATTPKHPDIVRRLKKHLNQKIRAAVVQELSQK